MDKSTKGITARLKGRQHAFVPGSPHTATVDPEVRCRYERDGVAGRIDRAISNSFGFGGANCSLVLGRNI